MATREEINVKYANQLSKFDDQITNLESQIVRVREQRARVVEQKNKELENVKDEVTEDAQAAITTGTVGDAATAGGEANYAPSMGVVSRVGYMAPKKQKSKKKKKTYKEYIEYYTEN